MQTVQATLIYLVSGGKTLMLFRNKKKGDLHREKYNGLGGKFEPGETPYECAVREFYEESGLTISDLKFKGHILFPKFDKEGRDWFVYIYRADSFSGEIKGDLPEGELHWILNHKLIDLNLWEGDKIFLKELYNEKSFDGTFHYKDGKLVDYRFTVLT